ncbi:MAG: cell division protein FtsA [Bacteroides sp.]|nr:cell division protein FtsA [Bacteroides sp.]
MASTDFIVAIELGSSSITGVSGKKSSDGTIEILACASENSSLFIRKGVIYNLDKTAQSLTSIINKLETILHCTIAKAYVGIGGQSLRTVRNVVIRHLESETIISPELIDEINDENREIPLVVIDKAEMDILYVAPQEYKIGHNFQIDPVGVAANHIEGRFLNLVARSSLKKNLLKCFAQANLEIANIFISPLVTADALLTETEKRSGCALVDFGADTTTVSVYKNNILRYLTVIPLGGSATTKDISSLHIEEEEAEKLKIVYGSAVLPENNAENEETYPLEDDSRTIPAATFNDIVEARTGEILANVWNQIQLSGYEDKLLSGIIITGGASNLRNLEEALRERTKLNKIRKASTSRIVVTADHPEYIRKDGTQNTVIGLLNSGNENCCKPEQPQPEQPSLFSEGLDYKKIEEKEKAARLTQKKKEEEDKKRRKEEEKRKKKEQPGRFKGFFEKITNDFFSDDELK